VRSVHRVPVAVAINSVVNPPVLVLREGLSDFALLYLAARIIERLLEPFSAWV
jgi:hypothetical protein